MFHTLVGHRGRGGSKTLRVIPPRPVRRPALRGPVFARIVFHKVRAWNFSFELGTCQVEAWNLSSVSLELVKFEL